MPLSGRFSSRLLHALAFTWGACTFFPVGVGYLNLLLMLMALGTSGDLCERVTRFRGTRLAWPMAAFLAWALVAAVVGPWVEDSPTRLFHIVRVLLVLTMGMLLSPSEARLAIGGFLVAALLAALAVAVHHVWGLPEWDIWGSLLRSRNNFSSGNMIMMATAVGLLFYLGLASAADPSLRWAAWGGSMALLVTVAEHALSRNAQILLPTLLLIAIVFHYRGWRSLALALALVGVMALAAWEFSPATQGRFDAVAREARRVTAQADYTTGVGERWRMAVEAWNGMLEKPLFGTGLGSWLPRWREVALQTRGELGAEALLRHTEINNPHNDFLLAGMESGVPGLLGTAWLLAALLAIGWRSRTIAGGATVVLASSVFLTALINAPLRDAALGMTLLWLLGASIAAQQEPPHA